MDTFSQVFYKFLNSKEYFFFLALVVVDAVSSFFALPFVYMLSFFILIWHLFVSVCCCFFFLAKSSGKIVRYYLIHSSLFCLHDLR